MRKAFINKLAESARKDGRICLIVGDLGYSVVEDFAREFPDRFLNAGVAEQSMLGIASGWSLAEKKIVFVYSLGNFPTMRCLEQIRNDCCLHKANVKIVSVGSGITYGQSGYSHFAIEDLAVMRALPNISIFSPADPAEAGICLDLMIRTEGPAYIRIAKTGEAVLERKNKEFQLGDYVEYRKGKDLCLIGIGTIISECLSAAEQLREDLSSAVIGIPVFKPLREDLLVEYLKGFSSIATVEEHSSCGGLASVVGEIIARHGIKVNFLKLALPEGFNKTGSQSDLRSLCGLSAGEIASLVRRFMNNA